MKTNSFTIARYILLFLVCGAVFMFLVWLMTSPKHDRSDFAACRAAVADTVNKIWHDNPTEIPPQYVQMVTDYADFIIEIPTSGRCNDSDFTCAPGMRRRDCNPCAAQIGAERAREQYINDMAARTCVAK